LIDKTKAHHDPKFDGYLPERMANRVVVTFADGRQNSAEVIEALGSPERPLSFDGVLEKAMPLIDMVDSDIDLPAIADIDDLIKLLVAANYDAPTSIAAE
jgi:2-methylcitrate dehydratase PrpD